jgi:hypothetical protein
VAFLQPGHIIDRDVGSRFDATVIAIVLCRLLFASLYPWAFCSTTNTSTSSRNEPRLPLCVLIEDCLSNFALIAHSVDGHGSAGQLDVFQKRRKGGGQGQASWSWRRQIPGVSGQHSTGPKR